MKTAGIASHDDKLILPRTVSWITSEALWRSSETGTVLYYITFAPTVTACFSFSFLSPPPSFGHSSEPHPPFDRRSPQRRTMLVSGKPFCATSSLGTSQAHDLQRMPESRAETRQQFLLMLLCRLSRRTVCLFGVLWKKKTFLHTFDASSRILFLETLQRITPLDVTVYTSVHPFFFSSLQLSSTYIVKRSRTLAARTHSYERLFPSQSSSAGM